MGKFVLDNGSVLTIDSEQAMDQHTFETVLHALHGRRVEEIVDTSFYFRKDFQKCRKMLDLALSKASPSQAASRGALVEPDSKERVQIYILGLMLQHSMDSRDMIEGLQHVNDRRLDMLRGFALLGLKQYDDAEFYFDKIGYKRGTEICKLCKKDRASASRSSDPVVLCYADSSNWKRIEVATKSRDFLFRIGQSDTYQNEDNLDVQLTLIDQDILKACASAGDRSVLLEKSLEKLQSLCNQGMVSAEIVYMIGKVYHLMKKNTLAAEEYKRVLSLDNDYLPARFNLARIMGSRMDSDVKDQCVCDYNALLSLKHSKFDIDLQHCSDLIRRLGWAIVRFRAMDKSALSCLGLLREYVDTDALDNNAAIVRNDDGSASVLESLLRRCSPNIKDYVFYNLSVLKKDLKMLGECSLPEARMHIDLLTKNTDTPHSSLRAYLTLSKDLVRGKCDVFSRILHGCICIDEFLEHSTQSSLEEAESAFMAVSNSMYCVNGLGICAVLRRNYRTAIRLFHQIAEEYEGAYRNLGNAYFLGEDYPRAIEHYLKALDREGVSVLGCGISRDVLRFLARTTKDIRVIERVIEAGVDGLESHRALVLLELGETQKVREMGLNDPEVIRELTIRAEREESRKRKIAELEEYRKKRSIN